MPKNEIDPEKILKTGAVVGMLNLILSPLYLLDAKLGITASITLSTAAIFQFGQLGKERRPGSNVANTVHNLFAPYVGGTSSDLENTARNIVNGGAATFDEAASYIAKALK